MKAFLRRYYPWLIPILWLITYELFAVFGPAQTLSQIVWHAPFWIVAIVVPLVVILVLHFWFGLWGPNRR